MNEGEKYMRNVSDSNQPQQSVFDPNDPSANESANQSSDVDPNYLLLVGKNLVAHEKCTVDDMEAANDGHLTTTEKESLENYATALINAPGLPPAAKAALQNWLSVLASKQTSDPATKSGDTTETGTTTTAGKKPAVGGDPKLLAMDAPDLSPPVQTLGNLA